MVKGRKTPYFHKIQHLRKMRVSWEGLYCPNLSDYTIIQQKLSMPARIFRQEKCRKISVILHFLESGRRK